MRRFLGSVPAYVWTVVALFLGIVVGGFFPERFEVVAALTTALIDFIVLLVPLLIFAALTPSVATLVRRGLAGRFAGTVLLWFVATTALAGFVGIVVAGLAFGSPLSGGVEGAGLRDEIRGMFSGLGEGGGASMPMLAILLSVVTGLVAVWVEPLYRTLSKVEKGIAGIGGRLGYVMPPLMILFGVTIGVQFGPQLGMGHYLVVTLFTLVVCGVWWAVYTFAVVRSVDPRSFRRLMSDYYVPTAAFGAGTCSSLATLPINLGNIKKYGVRDEVGEFVVPFGAVVNMDASTLMHLAYARLILMFVFDFSVSWAVLFAVWPVAVLFTIAAPGLPSGIGTALWVATLFTGMVVPEAMQAEVIATWIALVAGVPDMFRTATNVTGDGYTAIFLDSVFDRFFADGEVAVEVGGHAEAEAVTTHHSIAGDP